FQLRLSDQNNLQQLLCERFEIRKHPNLFQHLISKVLRLIHDQDRGFARPVPLQQPVVKPHQNLALRARVTRYAEIRHHVIEKLRNVHPRIEDKCRGHLLCPQPFEQFIDERGLARSNFAGQQHEAFAALDTVGQARERLLRVPRQKQITRIRIDVERVRPKAEKFLVHARLNLNNFFLLFPRPLALPASVLCFSLNSNPWQLRKHGQFENCQNVLFGADRLVPKFKPESQGQSDHDSTGQATARKQQTI